MQTPLFLTTRRKLQDISWVAIFFSVVAPPAFPLALILESYKPTITMLFQVIAVIIRAVKMVKLRQAISETDH